MTATTPREAAQAADVTIGTVYRWLRMGAVKATKVARRWVIDTASLAHRISLGIRRTTKKGTPTMDLTATYTTTDGKTVTPKIKRRPDRTLVKNVTPLFADKLAALSDYDRPHVEMLLNSTTIAILDTADDTPTNGLVSGRGRLLTTYQGHPALPMDDMLDLAEAIRTHLDNA